VLILILILRYLYLKSFSVSVALWNGARRGTHIATQRGCEGAVGAGTGTVAVASCQLQLQLHFVPVQVEVEVDSPLLLFVNYCAPLAARQHLQFMRSLPLFPLTPSPSHGFHHSLWQAPICCYVFISFAVKRDMASARVIYHFQYEIWTVSSGPKMWWNTVPTLLSTLLLLPFRYPYIWPI